MGFEMQVEECELGYDPEYQNIPEDILFEIEDGNVIIHYVLSSQFPEKNGFCSCEHYESGCLDYMIEGCIGELPDGYYMIENANIHYTRGDGWTTDDDADLDFESIRVARYYEMRDTLYRWDALKALPRQVWIALNVLWGRVVF